MNKEKYIVPKQLFLASFIMAIVVYSISLILNIISLVVAADSFTFSRYWYLYLTIVLGIFLALGFILYSAWVLAFTKDKSNGGQSLIKFLSVYVLASATYSFLSSVFAAINYTSTAIVTLVLSILQLAVGIVCVLLTKKSPKIARIVLIVEFILFALSEFLNIIFYIIASNFLSMVTSMVVLAFEIVVLIALVLMKIEVENDEEAESTPLAKNEAKESLPKQEISQEEKLNLLLKYKSLLDNGVITQEEFDAKKKELL